MGGQACASVRVRVCARERAFRCGWGWGPGTITHFLNIRFEPWPALPATDLGEGVADISDISTPAVQSFSVDLTHTSQCMSRRPIAEPRAGKRDTPPLWRAHTQLYSSLSRSRRCCCCRVGSWMRPRSQAKVSKRRTTLALSGLYLAKVTSSIDIERWSAGSMWHFSEKQL